MTKPITKITRPAALILVLALLCGCGQMGDLSVPNTKGITTQRI